jgi:hypothetical protein
MDGGRRRRLKGYFRRILQCRERAVKIAEVLRSAKSSRGRCGQIICEFVESARNVSSAPHFSIALVQAHEYILSDREGCSSTVDIMRLIF